MTSLPGRTRVRVHARPGIYMSRGYSAIGSVSTQLLPCRTLGTMGEWGQPTVYTCISRIPLSPMFSPGSPRNLSCM